MSKKPGPKRSIRLTPIFLAAALVGGVAYWQYDKTTDVQKAQKVATQQEADKRSTVTYTEFIALAKKGDINRIDKLPDGSTLQGTGKVRLLTQELPGDNIGARLNDEINDGKININVMPQQKTPIIIEGGGSGGGGSTGWTGLIVSVLLMAGIMIAFNIWMQRRQMKGGSGGVSGFGKSKANMVDPEENKTTFDDVAGCDEAKEEVKEIVDFLKDPRKYSKLGGRVPRGALLVGPPGTGKTLLAKAVAGEAKVPFFSISGSDFVEMYVGVGAARVRDMFEQAKKNAPSIIFIDEIDAVGKQRGNGMGGGGNDEREQTLNAMLVEMDGFGADLGVIVIAATNRVDTLDKALLRPGRFDRHVFVGLPDINGREQILRVHARKVPLDPSVDLRIIARGAPGMAGADLANLVNEAALFAARRDATVVDMQDFEKAKDKIFMGPERKSMVMSEEEKRNTAWHESGHAIIGKLVPGNDPVHKVTIMPRGRALGLTWSLPDQDRHSLNQRQMLAQIQMFYGGRIAEEILAKGDKLSISTGASNDIERATQMAKDMVSRYGFHDPDDKRPLAVAFYGADNNGQYVINSMEAHNAVSMQVEKTLMKCEQEARKVLNDNVHILERMAQDLVDYETIDNVDIDMIMNGESIDSKKRDERQKQVVENLTASKARLAANDDKVEKQKSPPPPSLNKG